MLEHFIFRNNCYFLRFLYCISKHTKVFTFSLLRWEQKTAQSVKKVWAEVYKKEVHVGKMNVTKQK